VLKKKKSITSLWIIASDHFRVFQLHFFPPVKGIVSGKYDVRTKHFGTDSLQKPKLLFPSVLDVNSYFQQAGQWKPDL